MFAFPPVNSHRIKVFIHLCVNKLVNSPSSREQWTVKIGKNNWVNKFESQEREQEREIETRSDVKPKREHFRHGRCCNGENKHHFCDIFIQSERGANRKSVQRQKSHWHPLPTTNKARRTDMKMLSQNKFQWKPFSEDGDWNWGMATRDGVGKEMEIIHHIINHNREWSELLGEASRLETFYRRKKLIEAWIESSLYHSLHLTCVYLVPSWSRKWENIVRRCMKT